MDSQYVCYFRVSTKKQGKSKLGLLAQEDAINKFVSRKNGSIIKTFTEVESGKNENRPELNKAIDHCIITNSILLIAKLDRLARSVHFVSSLMRSGVEFIACDNEHANKLTIHILASIAEYEREIIGTRIKEALKQAKLRGTKLGVSGKKNLTEDGRKKGIINSRTKRTNNADEFAQKIRPVIQDIHNSGITTLKGVSSELNNRNIRTSRSGQWSASSVSRVLKRLDL